MTRARFITFEGGEGSGKTTQIQRLLARLRPVVGEVVVTREPGGSIGGEQIRNLLVNGPPERWSAETEALLMYAARRDHIERLIQPALRKGAWVISDRFHDSSRAYQGAAGGAPVALIDALEHNVLEGLKPDLTLLFDLSVDDSTTRTRRRTNGTYRADRLDSENAEFHSRVREAYLQLAAAEPERIKVIKTDQPLELTHESVKALVVPFLQSRGHACDPEVEFTLPSETEI